METSTPTVTSTPVNALWLDTFKDRGPVLFDGINRTPAIEDVRNVLIYISFTTLFVAFLIIFPGIRKERISTFICVTVSLILGAIILVTNFGTSWHVANATISSPYRAFSKEKIFANIGVCVGLQSVNITLQALPRIHSKSEEINYNERFYWIDPTEMKIEHKKALAKGLPFPILTVAEYLSQDGEGFCWGRRYRLAGYYASIILWASFCTWILMNVLLCAVPKYGVYCMELTGILMLTTNAVYAILLPKKPLIIPFENQILIFKYGWCFWVVLAGGLLAVIIGSIVTIIDAIFPNKFSTILEIDYDTPYRYFVAGNEAPIANGTHASATVTSSSATDTTTCCGHSNGGGTLNGKNTVQSNSLQLESIVGDDDTCSCVSCQPCHHQHHHCHTCHTSRDEEDEIDESISCASQVTPSLRKYKSDIIPVVHSSTSSASNAYHKVPLSKSITTTATIEYSAGSSNSCHNCTGPGGDHNNHHHHHQPPHHGHHGHHGHHHQHQQHNEKQDNHQQPGNQYSRRRRASYNSSSSLTYTKSQLNQLTTSARGVSNNAYLVDDDEEDEQVQNSASLAPVEDGEVTSSTRRPGGTFKKRSKLPPNDESTDQTNANLDEVTSTLPVSPSNRQQVTGVTVNLTHHHSPKKMVSGKDEDEDELNDGHHSDSSDISTTIIDGKRAISLHNFGKFAAQQQLKQAAAVAASTSGGQHTQQQHQHHQQYTQYNRSVSHNSDPTTSRYNIHYHINSSTSAPSSASASSSVNRNSNVNSHHQQQASHTHQRHRR